MYHVGKLRHSVRANGVRRAEEMASNGGFFYDIIISLISYRVYYIYICVNEVVSRAAPRRIQSHIIPVL